MILLLVSFIFFIALIGLTAGERDNPTWPEKFFKDSVSYMQSWLYKPAAAIAGFFEDVQDIRGVYKENQQLKATLMNYARDSARLNFLESRNVELEQALGFTERQKNAHRYIWHMADVVSVNPDPYSQMINVNLGRQDGIRVNMAVVSVDGLIGRVVDTGEFTSTVQLLTNLDYGVETAKSVSAIVPGRKDSYGIIERYTDDGKFEMNRIPESSSLEVGDLVVTSGLGGVFPEGLTIGKVISKRVGDFGITLTALIEPASVLDKKRLREVFVVEVPQE